jgi:hypothetical protein
MGIGMEMTIARGLRAGSRAPQRLRAGTPDPRGSKVARFVKPREA